MKFYLVYKDNGLYDPVLDAYDPLYEPIDQDDFDRPSQPTEVFQIKQFTESFGDNPDFLDPNYQSRTESCGNLDLRSFSELRGPDRSVTESPFLLATKPYRPFSTEPTPVPQLEEPIILNPKYHDDFSNLDDVLKGFEDSALGETRFKLPISEQYDPDGTGKISKPVKTDTASYTTTTVEERVSKMKVTSVEEKTRKEQKGEVKFMEKTKKEIDLDNIDTTAVNIVHETIEKAITVANEINREINLELSIIASEAKSTPAEMQSKSITKTENKESINYDKTTDVNMKESDVCVAKEVAKYESANKLENSINERKASSMQEQEKIIFTTSVNKKSEIYNKDVEISDGKVQIQSVDESAVERKYIKDESDKKDVKRIKSNQELKESELKREQVTKTSETTTKSDESKNKEAKYTTAKLLAEQRAYTIGLQTIPHIKGTVQSSYQYDLLLKTFFIHLTDVMVALSRFILTDPVLSKPLEPKQQVQKEVNQINNEISTFQRDMVTTKTFEGTVVSGRNEKVEVQDKKIRDIRVETTSNDVNEESHAIEVKIRKNRDFESNSTVSNEVTENRVYKSGAEMSQLTQKRSEELIHKMDGVITEFQTKAGLEEEMIIQRDRRSRSRSKIDEDGIKVSDKESSEMKRDSQSESKNAMSKDGKNTYIAIVEAHVYTNKNSIFDAITEMSETASAQSCEETNIGIKVKQAIASEPAAIDSQSKQGKSELIEPEKNSGPKIEETIVIAMKEVDENLKEPLQFDTREVFQVKIVETDQPIVELQEDIVEKGNVCIEIKDKMEIEEIQSSEYVSELNILNEKNVQIQDVEEVKKVEDFKISEQLVKIEEVSSAIEKVKEVSQMSEESVSIKVTKEEITETSEDVGINQEIEYNFKQSMIMENKYQSFKYENSVENSELIKESSFTAKCSEATKELSMDRNMQTFEQKSESIQESTFAFKSSEDKKKLTLDLDTKLKKSESGTSVKSTIDTPTPSTVPPTPLTDEYVFRLQIPLPKISGPPIPRSPSPEDEDPHIVKKNLVPHIDTEIIEEVVYDTPLLTPPEDKVTPPVYTKPGLKGGNTRFMFKKMIRGEEIQEIERKSSLLASAIDQTIKSIEEYKEEVGIDTKPERPLIYNGYSKVIETRVFNIHKDQINVEQQVIKNTESINKIVENREIVQQTQSLINGVSGEIPVKPVEKVENSLTENTMDETEAVNLEGYRPVPFNPDDAPHLERVEIKMPGTTPTMDPGKAFVAEDGEIIGTHQGIVDGLEEPIVDEELAKEQGKPGMTEEKIAELISGESEMLREAHVMGLSRVLQSHMHRNDDDSSVDFKKIKPIVESLKDSEVLKALNEEFMRTREEKKKEERKWTKFLQKPSRPVPKSKLGCYGYVDEDEIEAPYKVKIIKQPKPKVAPDYKPEDFNTGALPWEERALNEPPPPPVEPEDPILVPEETPEFLEALDNLPESEVPDLEETGIPLPPEPVEEPQPESLPEPEEEVKEVDIEAVVEENNNIVVQENNNTVPEMEENRMAEQLVKHVEGMVDPNAPLEQQLAQMRAQLAALAQLPGVIQQTLELVTRQLGQITQGSQRIAHTPTVESTEAIQESNENSETIIEEVTEQSEETQVEEVVQNGVETVEEEPKQNTNQEVDVDAEEMEKMKRDEQEILGEQRRIEKQKKELMAELQLDQEARQLKQRPTPRVGKPKPMFGPLTPAERPVVLPGGRKWRKPKDAYNDQFISETLMAQAEIIQGKAMGVNFMKYEKPPVSLDHLQHSDVYKLIHDMEQTPGKRVSMRTPTICEADYREKCCPITPCANIIG